MHEEPTTVVIQRYLDALPRELAAEPIIRELLERAVPPAPVAAEVCCGWGHRARPQPRTLGGRREIGDEHKQPPNVNQRREAIQRGIVSEYKVRVGDLCFVIIGQIANRRMNVIRYQPTACIVINSPVETPSLAHAVKADWGGLTVQHHEASLIEDSKDSSEYAVAAALIRLRFYYPEAAARLDLKAP